MNIYVGGLSFKMREDELRNAFEEYGEVTAARIISDKFTGRSKGFGFVEMPENDEARKAIEELNGREIAGRRIIVNESVERERTERPARSERSDRFERSDRRPSYGGGGGGRGRDNDRRGGGGGRRDRY